MLFVFSLLVLPALAQRPSDASLCDYYAIQQFGVNTTTTQFNLVQSILALAFAGPSGLSKVSSDITGIFNPGTYQSTNVDLGPWFNGSIDSTNVNGQASSVNWIDGGWKAPLTAFLAGKTSSIVLANTTNEYEFFTHQFSAFNNLIGCSEPAPVPPQITRNLAYVHKFMDLNHTEIGHFINQITLSAAYFGFAEEDSDELNTQMNAVFNVRCSPAVGTQLYSLCQDETCPLAPNPNCAVYADLGPSGIISAAPTATAAQFTPTIVVTTVTPSSTSKPTVSTTPSSTPVPSSALPGGDIAGIAIGGAALTFAFVLALVFLLKRRNNNIHDSFYNPSPSRPSYLTAARSDPHTSYHSNQIVQAWNGPPIAEMESTVGSPVNPHFTSASPPPLSPSEI